MKPCPFCNSTNLKLESEWIDPDGLYGHEEWIVWCRNCGAIGPNQLSDTEAMRLWNLRRPMDSVMEHVNNALQILNEI